MLADPAFRGTMTPRPGRPTSRAARARAQVQVQMCRSREPEMDHMTSTPRSDGDLHEGEAGDSDAQLTVGRTACVWNHFLGRWTGGFAVAEVLENGYRLRRLSDDYVFGHVFRIDEVTGERRQIQEFRVHGIHVERRRPDSGE